jgi:hypothetical protein
MPASGVIAAYNGTFSPFLTRYFASSKTFTHTSYPGWSTIANTTYGGIAAYKNFIFVTDMATGNGGIGTEDKSPKGVVRFDTSSGTGTRFAADTDFIDLNIGVDGNLYALPSSTAEIHVYDPGTLALVRKIKVPDSIRFSDDLRAIAADQFGRVFVCGLSSQNVHRLSPAGVLQASKATGFSQNGDIDVDETGRLIVGQSNGRVLIGESTLTNEFSSFTVSGGGVGLFVSFARPITPIPGLVGNVSTRLPVGTGDDALIEGFIVQGPQGSAKKILVRAIGPSLLPFGINDALANPTLEIHDSSGATVATNNDWKTTETGGLITGDQSGEIAGSGLAPGNDLESAIIANLAPGSYTAVVRGAGNGVGTGVVDAYDLSAASPAKLANIATRGLVQAGDKLMIAGFIVQNAPVRTVVRAIGPSLLAFGINNALQDTTLQLRDQNGAIVRENDNWRSDQSQELEESELQPSHDLEAALIATIQPGQYTAQVRGKNDTSGIGVVQVYFLQ